MTLVCNEVVDLMGISRVAFDLILIMGFIRSCEVIFLCLRLFVF